MSEQVIGLRCPLCNSYYTGTLYYREELEEKAGIIEEGMLALNLTVGAVCNNQSYVGTNPRLCTPEHPCPGILERYDGDGETMDDPDPEDF